MPKANVTMNVRTVSGVASIIDIQGDVTAFAEGVLNEAFSQASANGVRAVVLNFNDLEYMNSSGIGLLVTMLIRAKRQGQKLSVSASALRAGDIAFSERYRVEAARQQPLQGAYLVVVDYL